MRRSVGGGWSIELPTTWVRVRASQDVIVWRAPGRSLRAAPGNPWRCADGTDVIAALHAEMPPDPTATMGEGGRDGVGHRAAWLYRRASEATFTLYGYSFVDGAYLETVFTGTDTSDPGWALRAWRSVSAPSVTRAAPGSPLRGDR